MYFNSIYDQSTFVIIVGLDVTREIDETWILSQSYFLKTQIHKRFKSQCIKMPPKPNINSKKAKLYNSRTIRAELNDSSFKEGKLSVPEFLSSRNFEIKSFELSQLNSKYALSTRCFQSLPRTLRRRTASHNVKRIPKRLRNKALREMQNSVNGVPSKKNHVRGKELYRLKMSKKLLKLASRIKLMKSIPEGEVHNRKLNLRSKLKILDEQIKELGKLKTKSKLNNKIGSYDNTGIDKFALKPKGNLKYSKRQNEFVWIPSHVWHAKRFHMIKRWGYQIPLEPTQKCFKSINRASRNESIIYDTSYYDCLITEIIDDEVRTNFLNKITRFSGQIPSKILNGHRSYDDWLFMDGKKIGKGLVFSIRELNKILIRVHPSLYEEFFTYVKSELNVTKTNNKVFDCRYSLGSIEINGPKSIQSISKIFHLKSTSSISKKWFGLAKLNDPNSIPVGTTFSFDIQDPRFYKAPVNVPVNETPSYNDLIISLSQDRTLDLESVDALFDNEQRDHAYNMQLSTKEISREFLKNRYIKKDSSFPVFITKLKSSDNWCVICPWYWTLPIWLKLNQVHHISTGGLKQLHQINFEHGKPLYPIDFQFLKEGWLENQFKISINQARHMKSPKSKRPNYEISESIVNPFGCDWGFLQKLVFAKKQAAKLVLSVKNQFGNFDDNLVRTIESMNDIIALIQQCEPSDEIPIELYDKYNPHHQDLTVNSIDQSGSFPKLPVLQIDVHTLGKGNIHDNARIYKLPAEKRNDYINGSLEECPVITDLIGFLSSGSYNLNQGRASGIGCIIAGYQDEYILVRNIGSSLARIAKWKQI